MPEITGLDKHLLRRGGPGWPSLSSTVVLVYCFFPPSSIYSSVLLNVLGVGRWWVRCDGSTKAACTERDEITFWHTRGLGERKHTNAHLHVCKHSGAYKAQTSLFVHHCVYVTIIWICWQIWSTETCANMCVCVSLRASVFRLSEELCYRLCFLSNFVCQNETKIIWCLLSIQASYPIYLDQCLEKAVWVNEWVTLLLTLDHWPRWPPNLG